MIENATLGNAPLGGAQLTTEWPPRIFPRRVLAKAAMSRDTDAKTDPKSERLFDKRTVERNIKKTLIGRKDYEKHLKTLPDVASKGVYGGKDGEEGDAGDEGASGGGAGGSNSGH